MPDTSVRRRPGKKSNRKSRNARELKEFVVLQETSLPAPAGRSKKGERRIAANSREGRRFLRQAARDGSSEAQALLEKLVKQKSKSIQTARTEPRKPQPVVARKTPAVAKTGFAPIRSTTKKIAAPGFETLSESTTQKKSSPTKFARADVRRPDLISSSIERKVAIGNIKPQRMDKEKKTVSNANMSPVTSRAKQTNPGRNKPVQLVNFDLANTGPAIGAGPVEVAQAETKRKPLADIIKSISIPEAEKKVDVVPVDLDSIEPAKKQPEVNAKPKEVLKKIEPKKETHPKRYWVQLATGSNVSALKYDFRRMKKKNTTLFGDLTGWTSPWGKTRRMVIGPFEDLASAKKFDAAFRKNGGDSFAWVSAKGTKVNKLP